MLILGQVRLRKDIQALQQIWCPVGIKPSRGTPLQGPELGLEQTSLIYSAGN